MAKVDDYRSRLAAMPTAEWVAFLGANSGLPGPRGNLELIHAVAEEADPALLWAFAASDDEFLAACGAVGLGRLRAEGDLESEATLHRLAADPRWRVREGVAMALQRIGDVDIDLFVAITERWAGDDSLLVCRAAIAGLCEPRLLGSPEIARRALDVLDGVTVRIEAGTAEERRSDAFRVLRQALGYCWSVAVAAVPVPGVERFDRLRASPDRDVQWVVRENLKKARMAKALHSVGRD